MDRVTWLTPRKVMGIALRLSLVAAVVGGAWSFYEMHQRYMAQVSEGIRINSVLRCGGYHSADQLAATKNIYGLYDLSKVGCADKTFLANPEEISRAVASAPGDAWAHVKYEHYVHPEMIAVSALGFALLTLGLGLFIVFLGWLTLWVLGISR